MSCLIDLGTQVNMSINKLMKASPLDTALDNIIPLLASQHLESLTVLLCCLFDHCLGHLNSILALETLLGQPVTQVLLSILLVI